MKYTVKQEKYIERINHFERVLNNAENNRNYIMALRKLEYYLGLLDKSLKPEEAKECMTWFRWFYRSESGVFNDYDRLLNSILDYELGNRPF